MEIQEREIPSWLLKEETYAPSAKRDGFLQKTTISVMSVLSRMKRGGEREITAYAAPAVRTGSAVFTVVLISLSHNIMYPVTVLVILLVRLAMMESRSVVRVFKGSVPAALFSLVILLPAALLGSPHTLTVITVKVFTCVTMLGIIAETTSWNEMTAGLRIFRVPDIMIFTLDTSLKYIMLLGEQCFGMLLALKVRLIGRGRSGRGALTGIMGVTALKSREMAAEMYQAMECRGFDGSYAARKRNGVRKADVLYMIFPASVLLLFIYMEGLAG